MGVALIATSRSRGGSTELHRLVRSHRITPDSSTRTGLNLEISSAERPGRGLPACDSRERDPPDEIFLGGEKQDKNRNKHDYA